jgi:hypothetical protein
MGLIGNPVEIRSTPGAVTPPFPKIFRKGNPFNFMCHCPKNKDGKAVERAGEPEDLPEEMMSRVIVE